MRKRRYGQGSIYKNKNGSWSAAVSAGYDKRTGKRIRKKVVAGTKREAAEKLKELLQENKTAASDMMFADWMKAWYNNCRKERIRGNTARSYKDCINKLTTHLGKIPLKDLNTEALQNAVDMLAGRHYRTAQLLTVILRMALDRAIIDGLILLNPADGLILPQKPHKRGFIKPSKEDWDKLINADTSLYCWRMLMLTERITGLRRSEILGLHWENIKTNPDGTGTMNIKKALIIGEERSLEESDTKSEASTRQLPLPKPYMMELEAYHMEQMGRTLERCWKWNKENLVFTTNEGNAINPDTFSADFYRVRKRLGIEATFHMLRHDMATSMKETGLFDVKDIQGQLGHSSAKITLDTYTHTSENTRAKVGEWIASRL